jgi:predicted permease
MSGLRNLLTGLRNLVFRRHANREIDEEISGYMEFAEQAGVNGGLSATEARRKAQIELGSADAVKERTGAIGWEHMVESVAQDVTFALRVMRRSPVTSAITVLTLALGIGANSAMFGIVYGMLFKPLPFEDEQRIAVVHMHFAPQNNPRGNMSLADFVDWKANNRSFEKVAAYSPSRFVLSGSDRTEEVVGALVTADYFSVLRMRPTVGRTFVEGDDSSAAPAQVVISESLWQRRFQRTSDVVGKVIQVNGTPATIVGVVPSAYGFPRGGVELWRNQTLKVTRRGPFFFHGIGRLKEEVDLQQAMAETNTIARNIESASPGQYSHLTMPLEPLHEFLVGRVRPTLLMVFAAVGLVLLIAVVNVANILLARATARQREIATRLSLGATRRRLMQQLLTESILMSLVGGACGLWLAEAIVRVFRAVNPTNSPVAYQAQIDWRVMMFAAAVSLAAGVAFGIVPAIHSSRNNVQSGLAEGGRSRTSSRGHSRTRAALVVSELAISLVLLQCAGLLLRSFMQLQRTDSGVTAPPEDVLTIVISPSIARAADAQTRPELLSQFYARAAEDLGSIAGVEKVAISDSLPPDYSGEDDTFRIAGQPWSEQAFPSTSLPRVTPEYFKALGVPLIRGRYFTDADTSSSEPVTIVSESLAKKYFPNSDPVGQKLGASGPGNSDPFMTIVGVVGDLKYWGLDSEFKPAYYLPMTQNPTGQAFVIVKATRAANLGPVVTQRLRELDNEIVVRRVLTLQEVIDESVSQPRIRTTLLVGFGALALLIASVGLYGVIAYSVTERTQEIGIRMALGADRMNVLQMFLRHGVTLCLVGITTGLALAMLSTRALEPFMYATKNTDPLTLAGSCIVLLAISVVATLLPAFRATRVEPMIALRNE